MFDVTLTDIFQYQSQFADTDNITQMSYSPINENDLQLCTTYNEISYNEKSVTM